MLAAVYMWQNDCILIQLRVCSIAMRSDNASYSLMSEGNIVAWFFWCCFVSGYNANVCATDPAGHHFEQNLIWPRSGHITILAGNVDLVEVPLHLESLC
jgi:hypothetical protein